MARKKKQKHGEEEAGEAWLLPYSDLMTLLLAVFIVLFAVSKVDTVKSEEMAQSFREIAMVGGAGVYTNNGSTPIPLYPSEPVIEVPTTEGTEKQGTQKEGGASTSANETQESANATAQENTNTTDSTGNTGNSLGQAELDNLSEIEAQINALLQAEGMTAEITTDIDSRGLIISLNNAILFESGSAEIKVENEDALIKVAQVINTLDNYIRIEGHTDNRPISTAIYPSNWELSTARASSVVRLFINDCGVAPDKVVAVGYGENKPIAENDTEEGRAKNRRIDIIVLSEKYNNLENQGIQ